MELYKGIEVVGNVPSVNIYSSPQTFSKDHSKSVKRQQKGLSTLNSIMPAGPNSPIGDIGLVATPNTPSGLFETKKAIHKTLNGASKSKPNKVMVYDTETFGTRGSELFDVGQISLHEFDFDGKTLKQTTEDATVLAVGLGEDTTKKLHAAITSLENDPNALFNFNDDLKRSLADLTLYDDKSYFSSQTMNGKAVATMTGQASIKPSTKGTALSQKDVLSRMRAGLSNLTNSELTNDRETVFSVLEDLAKQNPVLAGHNVQTFDQPVMLEWMNKSGIKAPESVQNFFRQEQLDSLRLGREIYNQTEVQSKNFQLSNIFNFVAGKSNNGMASQAHFAGADTMMTGIVLNDELMRANKSGLATQVYDFVKQGDKFISEKGSGSFYENAFTQNAGQYDMTARWDEKAKKYVQNYEFQEAPVVAGHAYEFMGGVKDVEIDGVKHYSMVMQDLDTQTIKIINRQSRTELTDMLTNNYTKVDKYAYGKPKYQSRLDFIKEDNARRQYDSLFDPKMQNANDTIANRLNKSYEVLDLHDKYEKKGLAGHDAIKAVQDELNVKKDADDMYRRSYEKIEKTVHLKDRLTQERSLWKESMKDSKKLFPMSENKVANNQAQNLFISNIQKEVDDLRPDAKKDYSYKGMKTIPMTSQKGEITYLDVSSKKAIKSKVGQTLRVSNERGRGTVMRDFENMLNQVGGSMDEATILQLKTKVQKDISISGRVEPGTMTFVNNKIYGAASKSDLIVSSVPGKNIYAAAHDGTSQSDRFENLLTPKKSTFFGEVTARAKSRTIDSMSSETTRSNFKNFDLTNISEAASQRIKKSAEIVQFFDERVTSTAGVYGLDHGQRKKKTGSLDYNKRIKETIQSFEENNFVVNLDYLPESDDMVLFFTPQDSGALLSGMSVNEKRGHKKVHAVSIPLMNSDASVNINGTGLTMQYKASFTADKGLKGPNLTIRNTPEKAFDRLKTIPHNVVETLNTHQTSGRKVDTDSIIEKQIASYRHSMASGQASSTFAGDLNPEDSWAASSRGKNTASGFTVDVSDYGDIILEREHPQAFKEFQSWKTNQGKEHVNFIESGFNPRKEPFSVRNSVMNQLSVRWNEEYGVGTETGVQITRQGQNPKQFSSGKGSALDPRLMTPFGELNPATREQILKTQNYQLMNKESIQSYFKNSLGITKQDAMERRFLGGVTSLSEDYSNLASMTSEKGVNGVGVRTAFMAQDEIQQGVDKAIVDTRKEIEQLTAKKTTSSGDAISDIQQRIDKLKVAETELMSGRFATTDGQMVVSESLAKAMKSESQMGIRVKTGYQLPVGINERISAKTNGEAFKAGILKFDTPMSYEEMQTSGLLTKDGMLTVGNLVEESAKEQADDFLADSSQLYRVYKNSEILGIQRTEKGDKLILNQVTEAKNGSKFVDGFLGTRNTVSVMGDTAYEQFTKAAGVAGVQTIQEPINTGRNSWGGMLSTTIETTFENAMEDLDNVYAGGESSVPAVQRFMEMQKDKGVTVQDLSREEVTKSFMKDVFQKDLNLTGAGDIIALNEQANRLVYGSVQGLKEVDGMNPLVGKTGQKNYTSFLNKATEDYNFSDKNVKTKMSSHNVIEYAGTTTRAKLSVREMNILKSKLTHAVDVPDGNGGTRTVIERAADNPIMQKFEMLMENGAKEDHLEYARRINKAHPFLGAGDNLDAINQSDNVILDMTGSFQGNANENVMKGKNGELIFDASSLGELPSSNNRTKADMQGTMADPMSIVLNNEELGISNETLGDYQKRTGGQSFLKIGDTTDRTDMGANRYKKNYIPLIGNMSDRSSDFEEVNIREIQKDTEDIYANVHRYNNRDYSSQALSRDEIIKEGMPHTRRANEAISNLQTDVNRYTTSSKKSGLIKGTNTVRSQHGMSAKTGSYSFYDTYKDAGDGLFENAGKRREAEFFVSTDNAKAMIDGLEEQIYQANGLEIGEMNKTQLQEDIVRRIKGTRPEDEAFDVMSAINRFPTQSEGSINFMSMRIDEAMDKTKDTRIMLSDTAAKLMGADFDGDHVYAVLDLYKQSGQSAPELLKIQEAMMDERDRMESAAKAVKYEGVTGNSFKDITKMDEKARDVFFANFANDTTEALSTISSNVKSTGIGSMDNAMVANRNLLDTVYSHALNNGAINASQYNEAIQSFGEVSDLTVQNFISAKKFTPESVGITADELQGLTGTDRSDFILAKSQKYLDTQTNLPNLLRNVNSSNMDNIIGEMKTIGVIGEEQEALFRKGLGHVSIAQEATAGYGGIRNAAFDIAKSNGNGSGNIMEQLMSSPGSIIPTEDMNRFVGSMFDNSSEESIGYFNSIEKTGANISQNVARINARNSGSNIGFSEAAEGQLNNLTDLFKENTSARKSITSTEVLSNLKTKASKLGNSTAFKVGAGFSAMWMLGSAIKGGPTPEGDEAQQEATAQEVNPAALLTSPTARVTPNGENVRLNISGSGNVNQTEVSGIVNQMVGEMTGMPMNTNVNISDNTQELDRGFYENAMNKILGV